MCTGALVSKILQGLAVVGVAKKVKKKKKNSK